MAVTQAQIALQVGIDVSSVNKILNRRPGCVFSGKTVKAVWKIARRLGYDVGKLKFQHRRRHPRRPVSIVLELSIYGPGGELEQRGTAVARNLSLSGAELGGIVLPQQALPMRPHTIGIRLLEGPLKDVELRCRPVRFLGTSDGLNLGVEFLEVQRQDLAKLRKMV